MWFDGANLTKQQSLIMIFALTVSENLTRRFTEILLRLIGLHLPAHVDFPTTVYQLHRDLSLNYGASKTFYCCPEGPAICKGIICESDLELKEPGSKVKVALCNQCGQTFDLKTLSRSNNMFVLFDLKFQIETLLANDNIKQELEFSMKY